MYEGQYVVAADGTPQLIEVQPGVEVVADYPEPVFYTDNAYWRYDGGIWYRSGWYGGGWARTHDVPHHLGHISHPESYRHYRPQGWTAQRGSHQSYSTHGQVIHSRPAPNSGGHHHH